MCMTLKESQSSSVRVSHPVSVKGYVVVKVLEMKNAMFIFTVHSIGTRVLEISLNP
jgi:hypothetical protein